MASRIRKRSSLQHRFLRVDQAPAILHEADRGEDHDDRHHHHQLDDGEARAHQSSYFVPSSAVPSNVVYTSNTFWPPQVRGVGLVLIRAHAPFGALRHRIDRECAAGTSASGRSCRWRPPRRPRDARGRRDSFRSRPSARAMQICCEVGGVLELVDRRADFAQRPPQLGFARAGGGHLRQRHGRRRQDHDDRRHHQQLDERIAGRPVRAVKPRDRSCSLLDRHR